MQNITENSNDTFNTFKKFMKYTIRLTYQSYFINDY